MSMCLINGDLSVKYRNCGCVLMCQKQVGVGTMVYMKTLKCDATEHIYAYL